MWEAPERGPPHAIEFCGTYVRSQYPAIGNQCSLKPKTYEKISESQTGWQQRPISTKTISPRSSSERGRSAESSASGKDISRKRIVPPITSEAVTGSVRRISVIAGSFRRDE